MADNVFESTPVADLLDLEVSVNEAVLDHLLDALRALKHMGSQQKDARRIWCSDWLRERNVTNASSEAQFRCAKTALSRMKVVEKTLDVLRVTLKATIQHVTAQTSGIILAIGLSSLPDDVIARVFELYYEDLCKTRPPEIASFSSPIVLASICKHFRRIALHLPRLWEGVSFKFGPDWISCLKERCQHPAVFLEDMNIRKPFRSLLQLLHPIDQWKGLHIKYTGEEEGHKIFKNICPVTRESFKELHTLTIDRNQYDYFLELEDSDAQLTTMLSEDDHELLKNWRIWDVKVLKLKNIIPKKLLCPSLKEFTFELDKDDPSPHWDLGALKDLLWCIRSVESLTFIFCRAGTLMEGPQNVEPASVESRPVLFFHLTSLRLEVYFSTEASFLTRVMDMIVAPNTSKMSIYMRYDSIEDGVGPEEWISALLELPTGVIRTFPNVEDLDIQVDDITSYALPYDTVLRAVPRVRNLTLDIPRGILAPEMKRISERFGCLKDIRSLSIKNCTGRNTDDVELMEKYFEALQGRGELERFERFELEGCSKFAQQKSAFERLLGKRFMWKD